MSKNHNVNRKQLVSILMLTVMILNLLPTIPFEAEAAAPAYIASIGIAQDKHESDAKNELSGHTIINRDLNEDAGGDYVYIGYKTSTDPSKAITGIVFRVGENPPDSITYGGYTFNLVGGRHEANTAVDNVVDLNEDAGGAYIYTYVTRDPNYGPALTAMTVNESSSYSGWITGTNTGGGVIDLNQSAGGDYLYLHYQRYSATIKATYYYIDGNGNRRSTTLSKTAKNHLDTLTGAPDIPEAKYNGRSWTFLGWRDDDNMDVYEYSGNNISVSVSESGKAFRAQYYAFSGIGYNANGGSTPPSIDYFIGINLYACSSSIKGGYTDYTLERYNNPTHPTKCKFLGWSESSYASSATYADGGTIRITKSGYDIYAVWDPTHTPGGSYTNLGGNHSYVCTDCGKTVKENHSYNSTTQLCICGAANSGAVASLSKNGKAVAAYLSLNDAIQAAASSTAADAAVVTILQNVALGNSYQEITSGVFTIDLNGHEISNANSVRGVFDIEGEATNVTIKGDGENSKITGQYAGIEISRAVLTITGGSISGNSYGVYATGNSTVTISGGIFSGNYGVTAGNSTLTISDGTISSINCSVKVSDGTVTISGGTINGEDCGVEAHNSTVTVSGGNISSDRYGMYTYDNSTVTVSGGSISGSIYDICNSNSAITLTLGEDGVGAAFPGGISIDNIALNEILGEGASYWQGDIMIIPADDAAEITGDVVIKATCPHTASKSHYADLNNGTNHSCVCTGCNNIITETHSYINYVCACGAVDSNVAVASTTVGGVTAYHLTLDSAIQAVKDSTADDKAVVTILKNIALGNSYQKIVSGVFTIDLNGCEISNTYHGYSALYISGSATNITIKGDGENSKIISDYVGVEILEAVLKITGGTISGNTYGVYAKYKSNVTISGGTVICEQNKSVYVNDCTVTISGGSFSSFYSAVMVNENSTVNISGGSFTSEDNCVSGYAQSATINISGGSFFGQKSGLYLYQGTAIISGGSFSGDQFDIDYENYNGGASIALTLGENGIGATFPDGITVFKTTLNEILGEGAAYWQGDKMILPASDATVIIGGDVVIKAECKHLGDKIYTNNGTDHSYTCVGCNNTITEGHSYTDYVCACGAVDKNVAVASTTVDGVTAYHLTLDSAIQAVKDCTADDKAVVTILQNIDLGNSYQKIEGGVFTIDLNGCEISNENYIWGVLVLRENNTNVTIMGTGEKSKITSKYNAIEMNGGATLTLAGGNVNSERFGVVAYDSTVNINGGTISGEQYGMEVYTNSTVTITGGSINGDYGVIADRSTVTISGGSISGKSWCVHAVESSVTITDGNISGNGGLTCHYSTATVSGGSISCNTDIANESSTVTLTSGENGIGATFPDGITVDKTTLNAILGEGAAYWFNGNQITVYDDATEISGGDVVIKAKVDCVNVADYANVGYAVSGQVVTVSSEKACKVGYISEGAYTEIDAVDNGDGSYSFTSPKGVEEVILVIKGDTNLDRRVTAADIARVNAGILGKTTLTSVEIFAGDVDGNGTLTVSEDIEAIKSDVLRREALAW